MESNNVNDLESLTVTDPKTGKRIRVRDMRAEFERITRQIPRDLESEHAFIESKIKMIQTDPHLSDKEKKHAIDELKRQVKYQH